VSLKDGAITKNPKFSKSNVATAHPTAAELRGITIKIIRIDISSS